MKIQIFNSRSGDHSAQSCQISLRSVNPLLRCGDFSIFQDGGRHFGFVGRLLGPPTKSIWRSLSQQNLAGIGSVVLIICKSQYFTCLA